MKPIFSILLLLLITMLIVLPCMAESYDEAVYYEEGVVSSFSAEKILLSIGLGLLGGFLYTAYHKAQLKSVSAAEAADNYTKKGSFRLTESRDVFLYRNVTRIPRQQNNAKR